MTLLHEAVNAKKFDVRVVERNVRRGIVTPDQVAQSVDTLPDDSENAEWISLEEVSGTEESSEDSKASFSSSETSDQ